MANLPREAFGEVPAATGDTRPSLVVPNNTSPPFFSNHMYHTYYFAGLDTRLSCDGGGVVDMLWVIGGNTKVKCGTTK